MSSVEAHYSASDIEAKILAGIRAAGLNPDQPLTPEDLGALDHFHTGGIRATRELIELAQIRTGDRVLDVGSGLAGTARLLAASTGCQVDCVELSVDYCAGAVLLNRLTGLENQIGIHQCSALNLPFADNVFTVAIMQNVGMNIADKQALYSEIARVLKPGGRFVFQEMAAGREPVNLFPLPWAMEPVDNHLVSGIAMCDLLREHGFTEALFEDTSDSHLGRTTANATPAASGQLGLSIFVDNLGVKAENARRSLEEGRVRLVRGVFHRD